MGMFKLETDAKRTFQVLLRAAFGSGFIPEFKYDKDSSKSLIDIRREFPRNLRKFPTIVIGASSGDSSIDSLGPTSPRVQNISKDGTNDYIEYRGVSNLTIRFSIFAGSETDRDMIADFTMLCLRFLFKGKASEYGFDYSKITLGSDNQLTIKDEMFYTQQITISNCISEFFYHAPIELIDIINKIQVDVNVKEIGGE